MQLWHTGLDSTASQNKIVAPFSSTKGMNNVLSKLKVIHEIMQLHAANILAIKSVDHGDLGGLTETRVAQPLPHLKHARERDNVSVRVDVRGSEG